MAKQTILFILASFFYTQLCFAVIYHKPLLRINGTISEMTMDPKGNWLAYIDQDDKKLKTMEYKTGKTYIVTHLQVHNSYFFAPDGHRLFYREIFKTKTNQIHTNIKVYDTFSKKNTLVETVPYATGFLTYDPKDLKMRLLHANGVKTKKIFYDGQRLAQWQKAQRTQVGSWLANHGGVTWLTMNGLKMKKMHADKQYKVQAFKLSGDGKAIAWETSNQDIYISNEGGTPVYIGKGRDPSWHPQKKLLVYAGARLVAKNVIRNYDIKVVNIRGKGDFVTNSQHSSERWPVWMPDGKNLIYTKDKTNDIYKVAF